MFTEYIVWVGPMGGGHLFNPPTHHHKRGCLRTPTVLRPKFSKKIHRFPGGAFFFLPIPFQKKFSKKIHRFPGGAFFFLPIPFQKKFQKIFHRFLRRGFIFSIQFLIPLLLHYKKISTTIKIRNAYIRILYKLLYSFIIYLFAFIFYYFCIRR